ncbi:gliding motility-associated C-terminal domain-containing protein [uncultured Formosa sp.]|uniref:gliding motility-associated C-terminal domain-containing protein n=1 Tax=uncultured Formosa sp. TaxID=255435 RepID=UPI0026219273|nr:gliding motility-associated C-terminal domain-containing protein [uncultured Formosa sp.]
MKKYLLQISILLPFSYGMLAQTSNSGVLYVSENTQFSTVSRFDNLSQGTFNNDGESFIYSDFNNDGVVDFYENTGITKFIGSDNQNISGTQVSYLFNVVFNNSSNANPFHLSGEINISGTTDFYEGIVDNDNFGGQITFNTNGNHINTSDVSHVDGPVNKFGDQEFTFPIGDGGYYRLAGISAPENSSAFFKGKYYYESSNDLYSHELKSEDITEIDSQEYWIVESVSDGSVDGLITLSWSTVTTPGILIEAAEQEALTIVRWDESSSMWVDEGGVVDIDNQTITTATTNYGVFTLGRVKSESELPCSLIVYNYVSPNGDGKNDYFAIEKTDDTCARELTLQVFNRWGVKVYEMTNYGENGHVFNGRSSGRLTVKDSDMLPANTYYYILKYKYGSVADNKSHKKAGFLYLSDN